MKKESDFQNFEHGFLHNIGEANALSLKYSQKQEDIPAGVKSEWTNQISVLWLHDWIYKYRDPELGVKLRELYDDRIIQNKDDFRELNVLFDS